MSRESREAIFAVLARHYSHVRITIVNDLGDLEDLATRKPDIVFLGMKFVPKNPLLGFQDPEKIWVSDYLDEHGITYTGSSQSAHVLELNKPLAKQCVLDAGLKTSLFYVVRQNQSQASEQAPLTFPLFIKPTNRGGGLGIDSDSVAYSPGQLEAKVQSITTWLQSDSLVEEYLPGREFSVAILKDEHSEEFSVMPIELVAEADEHGARILGGKVKSANAERVLEVTDAAIKSKVSALAIDVFYALGARDYGRIDIRLDKTGTPHFLEANLLPSLISGYGSFPKACALNADLEYEPMLLSIVKLASARSMSVGQNIPASDGVVPVLGSALGA